jgi:hypothetical protein
MKAPLAARVKRNIRSTETFRQVIKKQVGRLATDRCSTQRPHGPLCRCETSAEQFVKEDKVLH